MAGGVAGGGCCQTGGQYITHYLTWVLLLMFFMG